MQGARGEAAWLEKIDRAVLDELAASYRQLNLGHWSKVAKQEGHAIGGGGKDSDEEERERRGEGVGEGRAGGRGKG